jgi:hypothetical protein
MPSSSNDGRQRAPVLGSLVEGWRRALGAPWVAIGAWLVTILVSMPLAVVLHDEITSEAATSGGADGALRGWDPDWAGEFSASGDGLAATFTREVLGATGTIAAVDRLLEGAWPPPIVAGPLVIYLLTWIFLAGAILDRLARGRPVGAAVFFGLGATYFPRLLRLAVVAAAAYWVLFQGLRPLLFGPVLDALTRNAARETTGLAVIGGLYAVFVLALGLTSLILDVARVRLVVEDRRSVLAAVPAALRFVGRRPVRLAALYTLNVVAILVIVRLWIQVAPGAATGNWQALLASQVYVVLRVWARMALLGSEAVFFQGELAHARYAAAPVPSWPESSSVEAIRNLRS